MDEELNKKFMIYEKEIRQIQEQLQAIEQAILDMNQINLGLDEIKGKKDLEILSPIGRGIFVKAKTVSDELTVDVGGGNFVKKTIPETKEMILEQVKKLEEMKKELEKGLEKIDKDMTKALQETQEQSNAQEKPHENNHEHGHDHSHKHNQEHEHDHSHEHNQEHEHDHSHEHNHEHEHKH